MSILTETKSIRQSTHEKHALARHLRQPSEDGYRTPVIEDPEHPAHRRHQHVQPASGSSKERFNGLGHEPLHTSSSSQEHARRCEKHHERDRCYLPEGFPKNLNWRQRIKHVTWAYFTLTMATGGTQPLSPSFR